MTKRFLALILCLVLCLSLFPAAALAEGEIAEAPAGEAVSLPQSEENDGGQLIAAPTEETEELAPAGDGVLDVPEDDAEAAEPVILSDSEECQEPTTPIGDGVLDVPEDEILRYAQDDTDDPYIAAEADEDADYIAGGLCGNTMSWVLYTDYSLVISGDGYMIDYTYVSSPWHDYRESIKRIDVNEGVKGIGIQAFFECCAVTSVHIPLTVDRIGNFAFAGCESLMSVN